MVLVGCLHCLVHFLLGMNAINIAKSGDTIKAFSCFYIIIMYILFMGKILSVFLKAWFLKVYQQSEMVHAICAGTERERKGG